VNPADELRVKQVALELGIPFTRVTRLIRRGALKADRPGPPGSWRVRRADLDAYIANRDREAADLAQRRSARARERIGSLEQSASAICKHTAVVGFCGQCEGQWLVQASGITYAFDLDAGMVTVMPGDVDDEDGLLPYPQLLMLAPGLGPMSLNSAMEVAVQDPWGEEAVLIGSISYISGI
jgi:excisionase family DNA binding protein